MDYSQKDEKYKNSIQINKIKIEIQNADRSRKKGKKKKNSLVTALRQRINFLLHSIQRLININNNSNIKNNSIRIRSRSTDLQ